MPRRRLCPILTNPIVMVMSHDLSECQKKAHTTFVGPWSRARHRIYHPNLAEQ